MNTPGITTCSGIKNGIKWYATSIEKKPLQVLRQIIFQHCLENNTLYKLFFFLNNTAYIKPAIPEKVTINI